MTPADVQGPPRRRPAARRDALIPLLQDVQARDGYLSREALLEVGRRLGLPASKVYGVASFYDQFRFRPRGRFHVQVCRGTACHVKGSVRVLEAAARALGLRPGETTRDGLFSLEVVACLGACAQAPVVAVNGEFHAGVTPDGLKDILAASRAEGTGDARSHG